MKLSPNQWTILEALVDGPRWIRSFQTVKPLLEKLVELGLIERCRPRLGRGANMIRLTDAGCAALEIDPADVPQTAPERAPLHQTKRWSIGKIRHDAPRLTRHTCEVFIRSVELGSSVPQAVGQIADSGGVQRPAIWRRLRAGGVLAPIRSGIRTIGKRQPEQEPDPPSEPIDRTPCPRCGVRADIGCGHSRVPLGTVL